MPRSVVLAAIAFTGLLIGATTAVAALTVPFHGALSLQIGSVGPIPIEGSGSAEVTLAPDGSLASLVLPAHAFHATGISAPVPAISAAALFPLVAVGLTLDHGAATFAPGVSGFGGAMPLAGLSKVCLFYACTDPRVVNVTVPAGVVGQGGTATAAGAVNVTVIGAPWTTGDAAPTMPAVRGRISESAGGGVDGLQLVTPIFIQTNLPALSIVYGSYVRIALELELCSDGIDNDGDGFTDYPSDPQCSAPTDLTEGPPGACENGLDDDGDGDIDLADSGCRGSLDASETSGGVCDNGLDDDGDGLIDLADPGCDLTVVDSSEHTWELACDNGLDDDLDGKIDYPADLQCASPTQSSENPPACSNHIDDDGDGAIDYPADSGCASGYDRSELVDVCSNGFDDDGDGLVDRADPGCYTDWDSSERGTVGYHDCDDGVDNDGDGKIDYPADPGCLEVSDLNEQDPPACDNGRDDDGDGKTDYPNDPGCSNRLDLDEHGTQICDDAIDDDGDGLADFPADPGCSSPTDTSEQSPEFACDDGIDDDGDGLTDHPADAGCISPADGDEHDAATACDDGVDNDGDQLVDFPADPDCASVADEVEGGGGPACSNGVDDDGDGAIDALDPSCSGPDDLDEAVVFDDGAAHLVDTGAPLGAESVRVSDGSGPTSLDVSPGGGIGFRALVTDGSSLSLSGGQIGGALVLRGAATAAMTGGTLGGVLRTEGSAEAVVQGGSLGPALEARGTSRIELRVSSGPVRGPLHSVGGTLTGFLEDGTPYAVAFQRAPGATIALIPEPASSLLGLVSVLVLARIGRRRSRNPRR